MKGKIQRWGNSLALRLPRPLATESGLREGDSVEIEAHDGALTIRRTHPQFTLAELIAGIAPQTRHEEVDWGEDVGRERVPEAP